MGLNDPLFINCSGTSQFSIAKGVTNYFAQTLNLHLHSTRMRSIVETGMQEALENGTITAQQKNAIENINGHDSATVRDYYLKKSRKRDADLAFEAFDLFDGTTNPQDDDAFDDNCYDALFQPAEENLEKSILDEFMNPENTVSKSVGSVEGVIGCKHPHFNQNETQLRAPWTKEEIEFVGNWCRTTIAAQPAWAKTIVAKCVKHIKASPSVREIFHPLHIYDSSRLRYAFDTFQKNQMK